MAVATAVATYAVAALPAGPHQNIVMVKALAWHSAANQHVKLRSAYVTTVGLVKSAPMQSHADQQGLLAEQRQNSMRQAMPH